MWPHVLRHTLPAMALAAVIACPAAAAQGDDPDWPCIQRKVPELSLAQIWNGPELPPATARAPKDAPGDAKADARISTLAFDVSQRRMPLTDAQKEIRDFAASLPEEQKEQRMMALVQALFEHMNHERSDVIAGIARYAHRQADMAASLRQEASAVDAMRTKVDTDPNELTLRNDRLVLRTRIFHERVQSLTFVCEVPTLIEQRLYALAKTAAEALESR